MKGKDGIFLKVAGMLKNLGLSVISMDDNRPWGGFYVIDEAHTSKFVKAYFPDENMDELKITHKLSPKILIVAPHSRLSWQYHQRRSEIWKCISGPVAVAKSDNDEAKEQHILNVSEIIRLKQGDRHRLIGLDDWGIVAEIWQHTDVDNPSDEADIVRVQDDYGR